jgi:hypothetical protein
MTIIGAPTEPPRKSDGKIILQGAIRQQNPGGALCYMNSFPAEAARIT